MAITSDTNAQTWLEQQDQPIRVAFASRCALRATPGLGFDETERLSQRAFPTLRTVLCTMAMGVCPTPDLRSEVERATDLAKDALLISGRDVYLRTKKLSSSNHPVPTLFAVETASAAAQEAARSAISTPSTMRTRVSDADSLLRAVDSQASIYAAGAALKVSDTAYILAQSFDPSTSLIFPAVAFSACDWDAEHLSSKDIETVFRRPLWPQEIRGEIPPGEPEGLAEGYAKLTAFFDSDPHVWSFWKRWLEGMRTGQPMDWHLQEQIALIPNEIWQAGPEAVGKRIDEVEKRFALKDALRAAEIEMVREAAQRLGIGGNNPPDRIADLPPSREFPTIIWEPFETLKQQVETEAPDTEAVKGAISKLAGVLSACGAWFGGKLDKSADEFFKSLGKWAGPSFIAYLASHSPQIQAVMTAAKDWLLTLLS